MLYMVGEYKKAYPKRPMTVLEKFADSPKNLHEMTLADINDVVKKWQPLSIQTIKSYKQEIRFYLKWLQGKNVATEPEIAMEIDIPLAENEYLIYSTKDLAYYYDKLFKFLEKQATINGSTFSKNSYYMSYAAGILAFYGLSDVQIIGLDLSDIQPDGVRGYNLPLTKEDIDILLLYKNITKLSNNVTLLGTKYIRSPYNTEIDAPYLSRPIRRIKFDEENEYLKALLGVTNIRRLGVFAQVYECEKNNNDYLVENKNNPQWFTDITASKSEFLTIKLKKEYIKYRNERNNSTSEENVVTEQIVSTTSKEPVIIEDGIIIRTKDLYHCHLRLQIAEDHMNQLMEQFAKITEEIANIKEEIKKCTV